MCHESSVSLSNKSTYGKRLPSGAAAVAVRRENCFAWRTNPPPLSSLTVGSPRDAQPRGAEISRRASTIRARVRSRPRSASTSNRPGLAVRPVTATRTAWIKVAAFTPVASATVRTAASVEAGIELGELRERRIEAGQRDVDAVGAEMLRDRRRIVVGQIHEEEASDFDELAQLFRTRPKQLEHGVEPCAPIADVRSIPNAGRFELGAEPTYELIRRELQEVLLIEPVELL